MASFDLPRLPLFAPQSWEELAAFISDLQIWWQQVVETVEAQEALQDDAIADIQTLQTQMATTISDLAAAVTDIGQAQSDATASARETARITSYPNPGNILSATDNGASATITISNHVRVYPVQGSIDVPDVSITGDALAGKTSGVRHWVFYDDTTLADTTPNFQTTTSSATAQAGAAAGRHIVGYVDTPAAGGGGTTAGTGGGSPGGGGGGGGSGYVEP